ncbi:MAG: hypothetical protein DRO39_09005 [Thermoprotei archaeon]|nr:MAG: hypothetical protein DRO39_09005 [Thermoprotei archaeon]
MGRRNIYEGPGSWYAIYEGCFVPGKGVDRYTAASIAALILRDLRRGWSYDDRGRRVAMTRDLARRRLIYLIALARKHSGPREMREVEEVVRYAAEYGRLPPYAVVLLAGSRAREVAEELRRMGIASRVVVLKPVAARPLEAGRRAILAKAVAR